MLEWLLLGVPAGLTALVLSLALATDADQVEVRSFTTSEVAAARGYSSERLAVQLSNDIEHILHIASTHHEEKSIEVGVADEPVEHLVDYLDMSPFVDAVQELSGNVLYKMDIALVDDQTGNTFVDIDMHRIKDSRPVYSNVIGGENVQIDDLILSAAEIIVQISEPYIFASYLHNKYKLEGEDKSLEEMMEFTKRVLPTLRNEEKIWHLNLLGIASSEFGQHDIAIGFFEEALRIDPHFALAEINIGRALHRLELYDEAMEYFQSALLDGELSEVSVGYVYWAESLVALGAYEEALAKLAIAEWITPDLALIYEVRADILEQRGHTEAAARQRRKADYARLRQPRQSYFEPV